MIWMVVRTAASMLGKEQMAAEIASGLAEGESVVARAGTFVRDGDVITPIAAN